MLCTFPEGKEDAYCAGAALVQNLKCDDADSHRWGTASANSAERYTTTGREKQGVTRGSGRFFYYIINACEGSAFRRWGMIR